MKTIINHEISTSTLVQNAVEVIEQLILHGEIKPGERLREQDLEKMIGISRTPIREALRCLEAHELAESFPRKGCCVRTISLENLYNTMEVGIALEEATLRLAHKRLTPEGIKALKDYVKGLHSSAKRKSPSYPLEAETEFIDLLNTLAQNGWLAKQLQVFRRFVQWQRSSYHFVNPDPKKAVERYAKIAQMLSEPDSDTEELVRYNSRTLRERYESFIAYAEKNGLNS